MSIYAILNGVDILKYAIIAIYILVLYSLSVSYRTIIRNDVDRILKSIAIAKIRNLVSIPSREKDFSRDRIRRVLKSDISILIAVFTILMVLALMNRIVFGLGLIALALIPTVSMLSIKRTSINIVKRVAIEKSLRIVEIEFSFSRSFRARVCDDIDSKTVVVDGDLCIEDFFIANRVYRYRYVALSKSSDISDRVYITFFNPIPFTKLSTAIKVRLELKSLSIQSLDIETPIQSMYFIEPSIDSVRPYVVGDDLKHVIAKSILFIGGLRTKILEKSREFIGIERGKTRSIDIVLGDYICDYYLGFLQLNSLLERLIGVEEVFVGSKSMSINDFLSLDSLESLCISKSSVELHSLIAIVSPDSLSKILSIRSRPSMIIVLYPIKDKHLDIVKELIDIDSWLSEIEKSMYRYIDILRSRGIDVVIYGTSYG